MTSVWFPIYISVFIFLLTGVQDGSLSAEASGVSPAATTSTPTETTAPVPSPPPPTEGAVYLENADGAPKAEVASPNDNPDKPKTTKRLYASKRSRRTTKKGGVKRGRAVHDAVVRGTIVAAILATVLLTVFRNSLFNGDDDEEKRGAEGVDDGNDDDDDN